MSAYKCVFCKSRKTTVKETRPRGLVYRRIRICPNCKGRFTTIEVRIDEESEDYINIIARISTERLLQRFLKSLHTKKVKSALVAELKKTAGVAPGNAQSPKDLFR